jgi:hypothetical protein
MTFAEVVDHKFPVVDGGSLLPGLSGVWSLCSPCHGVKASLERYARETDQLDQIVFWCDDPSRRPRVF